VSRRDVSKRARVRLRPIVCVALAVIGVTVAWVQPALGACGSWERVRGLPMSGRLSDVSASSATNVWAVGWSRGRALTERWNGSTWERFRTPNPTHRAESLTAVVAIGPSDVWAAGQYGVYIGKAFLLHWNGTGWHLWPLPKSARNANLTDLAATSGRDVWAVGETRWGHRRTLHFNGERWRVIPTALRPEDGQFYGVAAITRSDVWAVGQSLGHALVEHWDGKTWSRLRPRTKYAEFHDIAATSANDIWAVATWPVATPPYHEEHILRWDGISWTTVDAASWPPVLTGIAAAAADEAWAVGGGSPEAAQLATYHWDGTDWSHDVISISIGGWLVRVTKAPATTSYWAVGTIHGTAGTYRPLIESYC
jgi:hypothetical protein